MDVFLEQIVGKKTTSADILKKIGIILAAVVIIFLSLFVLPLIPNIIGQIFGMIGLLVVIGAIYGAYYLISGMSIEYEYILTNGEIDVDKIIARRKRKRLITVDTRDFEEFGLYRNAPSVGQNVTTIMACISPDAPNTYYALLEHSKFGRVLLVFNPNEKILTNAKQFMKRNVIKV
jgi:hypothetical protein